MEKVNRNSNISNNKYYDNNPKIKNDRYRYAGKENTSNYLNDLNKYL